MTLTRRRGLDQRRAVETYQRRQRQRVEAIVAAGGEVPGLAPVSPKRMEREGDRIRRAGSTIIEQGRGMSASREQQAKTREADGCRILAAYEHVELELWPRDVRAALMSWNGPAPVDSMHVAGPHSCTDRRCTIPGVRPLHRAYDGHRLDILAHLSVPEQAHAAGHVGIVRALDRVTGRDWLPVVDPEVDRLPDLTYVEQAEQVEQHGGLVEAAVALTGVPWMSHAREAVIS